MKRSVERSPASNARVAGLLYILRVVFNAFAVAYVSSIIVPGDVVATASNIVASESLFRIGLVGHLIGIVCLALVAIPLYALFKPVNRDLSAIMAIFVWLSVPIFAIVMLTQFVALTLLSGAGYLIVFTEAQLSAQVVLSLDVYDIGYHIGKLFFSLYLFPLGYLVYRSGFLPRVLGVLLVIAGCANLIDCLAFLVLPSYEGILVSVLGVFSFAELMFGAWLLVKGVRVGREQEERLQARVP